MSTESTSPDGGAMSVEQAVEALNPSPAPQEPAAPEEAAVEAPEPQEAPSEAEPEAEETPSEPDEATAEEDETVPPEPETPAIEPPSFWDADAKAAFAALPPEQQSLIAAAATKQAKEASKAIQQAAEARKTAESQAGKVNDLAAALNDFLPRAVDVFKGKWDGIDWSAWAEQDPTEAFKGKLQYEAEMAELQRMTSAKEQADKLAAEQFVKEEFAKLPEVAPELVDPKEGQARRTALARYLVEGEIVTRDQLANLSAKEMSIAYKAMLFDQLKAAPPKVQPKTAPLAAKPPARPAAAPQRTPQSRSIEQLTARLAKTGDVDDAVRLIRSRQGP